MRNLGHELEMVLPCHECRASFLEMVGDFHAVGESGWPHGAQADDHLALDDFDRYVRQVDECARGENLPPGWVPVTTYWLMAGRRCIGTLSLRHRLNEKLEYEGGHIGYCIRPSDRRKGYMTRFLKMGLDEARKLGLTRVLITCAKDNIASVGVIRRCGGVLEDERPSRLHPGNLAQRYWIDL